MAATPKPVRKAIKKETKKRMEDFSKHGRSSVPKHIAKKETKRIVKNEIGGKKKQSKLKGEQFKRHFK